ncbi:membrane-associated HD superfamily phosphohydrolase [Weissella uvarum]|uniref:DUF4811 domain-containing protein n=1 Tax=Weissella uvarum TaxID=1479233 RepID=UPI00195FEC78|nr:DUF4811 domain-containing protein [Weissella uvarum]MBM7616856.1 membrane-associated HD superfamily phosphohydrolase [Weissella uvarum]MCM0594692.1 DUF4811 domain-containing protein [Weissella uvarum]
MIVLLVLGIIFLLFTLLKYEQDHRVRWITLVIGAALVILNLWGLMSSQSNHLFMKQRTQATTEKIKPVAEIGDYNFVTTEAVGKHLRYTYRSGDKTYQTLAENTHMTVKNGNPATLKTQVTDYEPGNLFDRFMLIGQKTKVASNTDYTMTMPKSWHVVSKDQYQKLVKLADKQNDKLKDRVSRQTKAAYRQKAEADPDFMKDKKAQKQLQNKIVNQAINQNQKQLNQAIKQQLKAWHVK